MKYWPTKTPGVVRKQGLNWAPTLSDLGDLTIADSQWAKLHGSAEILDPSFDDTTTTVLVSGGTPGEETVWRNTVTLSNGYILDEDVFQRVRA
jgi:hypothetical protein